MPLIGQMGLAPTAIYPKAATLWLDEFERPSPDWLIRGGSTSQMYRMWAPSAQGGIGFQIFRYFFIAAGTYKMWVLGRKAPDSPIVSWYIDGAEAVSGQDWGYARILYNQVQYATVVIPTDGNHLLALLVTGIGPLVGGEYPTLTKVWFSIPAEG